jgi:hypothetical protein
MMQLLAYAVLGFLAVAIIANAVIQIYKVRRALGGLAISLALMSVIGFLILTAVTVVFRVIAWAWS